MENSSAAPNSLSALIADFLRNLRSERRLSAYTQRNYSAALSRMEEFLKQHLGREAGLGDLERMEMRDFRGFLASRKTEGVSAASINLDLSAIRTFFRFLERRHQLRNDAISALRGPKRKERLPRPVDADVAAELVKNDPGENADWAALRDTAIFALLYGAGLRISEALALTGGDLPLGESLRIKGKGSKYRVVPVIPIIWEAVEAYSSACPHIIDREGPLFLSARGRALGPRMVQRAMAVRRAAFGLPSTATPHALRHAFATELLAAGGDLRTIQELLGHASIAATQRYTKIDREHLLEAYSAAHPRA